MILSLLSLALPPSTLCTIFGECGLPCYLPLCFPFPLPNLTQTFVCIFGGGGFLAGNRGLKISLEASALPL